MWLLFMWASHLFFHVRHIYGIFIELWASNWIIIDDGDTSISAIITDCFPLICWFDQNTVCTYTLALCRILWLCLGIRIPSTNWKQPHFFLSLLYIPTSIDVDWLSATNANSTAWDWTHLWNWFPLMDNLGWLPHWMKRFMIFMLFEHVWTRCCWIPTCPKMSQMECCCVAHMNSDGSHVVEDAFKIFGNKAPRLLGDLGSMAWPRLNAQYVVRRPRRNSTNHVLYGSDIKLWWCPF